MSSSQLHASLNPGVSYGQIDSIPEGVRSDSIPESVRSDSIPEDAKNDQGGLDSQVVWTDSQDTLSQLTPSGKLLVSFSPCTCAKEHP